MKKFTYRLQKVLNLREQEESLAKLNLGQATKKVEEIDQGIQETHQEERSALDHVRDPREMFSAQNYILRMQAHRKKLQLDRVQAEKKRLEVLLAFTKARQKAEVLRKLREKHHDEWRRDMIVYEDAQADDLSSARLILGS